MSNTPELPPEGQDLLVAIVDEMEAMYVRRDEFDALRAQVEELRRLVETTKPEEPLP